jgi:acyl carrier protein
MSAPIETVLHDHIASEILDRRIELLPDALLIEDGILTSLQTLELVMFIEEEFGIEVEPEEFNEAEFRSLRTIADLIRRKGTA